ncbi:cell wall hydrolase [Paracoccus sp. p4-l81]|uniref:cell wall hydrolase n=1 Tax=unclassified Paracoccus (in: a-proteobacteria) TaxID=2688777 RepID=UPI0035BAEAF3
MTIEPKPLTGMRRLIGITALAVAVAGPVQADGLAGAQLGFSNSATAAALAAVEEATTVDGQPHPRRDVTFAERQEQARRRTAERMAKTHREVPIRVQGSFPTARQAAAMQAGPGSEAELQCLAETLYFEARGESRRGQAAVAEVILNRVDSGRFPNTICGVVKQGRAGACQFSYNCGSPRPIRDMAAFARVQRVARDALAGGARELTGGATYFHTPAVSPPWSKRFVRTVRIDNHIFYRPGVRVAQN